MKKSMKLKIVIDILMVVLMLLEMAYKFTGNVFHEVTGIILFILFFLHNILNKNWYKNLGKVKLKKQHILSIVINISFLLCMVTSMVTAILISRTIFSFLGIKGSMQIREIHTFSAYWGFIIMSVHLGMHWNMIRNIIIKNINISIHNNVYHILIHITVIVMMAYGVYASFIRNIGSKLTLYYTFDTWTANEFFLKTLFDYFSIMWLYVSVTYYLLKFINIKKR